MTEWEPATTAEVAMRDALRVADQEQYFRVLARTELLLPVSADALAGRAPMGWGTWNSGGRTHVLAFTSTESMRICLAEHAGSARKIAYPDLAAGWPNPEWWLAVNPGLPIEGYLPPWFVNQLSRGDVRMPGRSGRVRVESSPEETVTRAPAGFARSSPTRSFGEARSTFDSGASTVRVDTSHIRQDTAPGSTFNGFTPPGRTAPRGDVPPRDRLRRTDPSVFGSRGVPPPPPPPPPSPPPADEPIDAEMVDIEIETEPPHRTEPQPAPRETARRPQREAIIIDAEIIESTVLDAASLGARFVNATVIDASGIQQADVIDVAVLDTSTEQTPKGERVEAAESRARARAAGRTAPAVNSGASFTPANEVERDLLAAAASSQIDKFLSTLLLARVLIPIPTGESPDIKPHDPAFPWRRETIDGKDMLVVFTSQERLTEYMGDRVVAVNARFMQLIHAWPDVNWPFAVNPGTPVGATLPGIQIKALAAWADDVGLTDDDPEIAVEPIPPPPPPMTIIMQKPIAPSQVDYYLDRGYDRASGFVHRATEIAHLDTPAKIYSTLGLAYSGTPFEPEADDIFVLRWAAHRPDLYRIPYGGQHEAAMRAMQGWMIERAPFRGNGFAPADNGEVIAEFKVDSVRLPHAAQMWRLTSAGTKTLIAMLDADECRWRPVRGISGDDAWDPTTPIHVLAPALTASASPTAAPDTRRASGPDPTEDPLDPRWSGRATSRVGER